MTYDQLERLWRRRTGRGGRHYLDVVTRAVRRQHRHAVRRRGRPDVAGQRPGRRARGRDLVLVGDPQQLAQPSHATHPPGAGVSALEHILGDHATMPADAGLLLDRTWRMHPQLCQFTSEVFYDGRLTAEEGLENQEILGDLPRAGRACGSSRYCMKGTRTPPRKRQARSPTWSATLSAASGRTTRRPVSARPGDILVLTPYNAQIRAIQDALAGLASPTEYRWGPSTSFRGERRQWPSTRWRHRLPTMRLAAWNSFTTPIG